MFFDLVLALLATLGGVSASAAVFVLLLLAGIGAPWSQDLLLLAAAGLTVQGTMHPLALVAAGVAGVLAGDAISLYLGHRYGARWIRRPWAASVVAPQHLPALEERMRRGGVLASFITRFLPGQRATLYFIAGTLRLPWRPFLLGAGLASLVQVPLFVWGVRSLGWFWPSLRSPFEWADNALTLVLLGLLLAAWLRERRRRQRA